MTQASAACDGVQSSSVATARSVSRIAQLRSVNLLSPNGLAPLRRPPLHGCVSHCGNGRYETFLVLAPQDRPSPVLRPRRRARKGDARVLGKRIRDDVDQRLDRCDGRHCAKHLCGIRRQEGLVPRSAAALRGRPGRSGKTLARAPTAREAVQGMLENAARLFTNDGTPRGCLLASAAATGSKAAADVREAAAHAAPSARSSPSGSRTTLREASCHGTQGRALADLAMAVTQGMSVLARDGADRAALIEVALASMSGWPEP